MSPFQIDRRLSLGIVLLAVLAGRAHAAGFIRADANADGEVNIADPLHLFEALFVGSSGEAPRLICRDAADANSDENIDVSDSVYILLYLFGGGGPPGAPFPECGENPNAGGLGCDHFQICEDPGQPAGIAVASPEQAFPGSASVAFFPPSLNDLGEMAFLAYGEDPNIPGEIFPFVDPLTGAVVRFDYMGIVRSTPTGTPELLYRFSGSIFNDTCVDFGPGTPPCVMGWTSSDVLMNNDIVAFTGGHFTEIRGGDGSDQPRFLMQRARGGGGGTDRFFFEGSLGRGSLNGAGFVAMPVGGSCPANVPTLRAAIVLDNGSAVDDPPCFDCESEGVPGLLVADSCRANGVEGDFRVSFEAVLAPNDLRTVFIATWFDGTNDGVGLYFVDAAQASQSEAPAPVLLAEGADRCDLNNAGTVVYSVLRLPQDGPSFVATVDANDANPTSNILVDMTEASAPAWGLGDLWRGHVAINDAGDIALEGNRPGGARVILLFRNGGSQPTPVIEVGALIKIDGVTVTVQGFDWTGRHAFNESAQLAVRVHTANGSHIVRLDP